MLSQQHNNNLQHLESYAATSIQTRNVEKCVATCFFPAPAPVSGPWSLHPWVSSSAASSLSCFGPQGGPCSWRDEICCLDFQLDKSYIYIYIVTPSPGPTLSFFRGICSRKTFILLSTFLCDLHTTTQVRYSLTLVFLQFLNCHLVIPLLHILRLRGCLPFKVK